MNRRILRTALAGLLASAAILAQTAPLERQIALQLTANHLKADVSFLAADALQGRGTPSAGLDVAAEFIAAQFRRAGLEPAGDDGYFQTASFASVTPVNDGMQLTLEMAGGPLAIDARSATVQEAAALDISAVPAIRIFLADPAALGQLTADQARGKVVIAAMPEPGEGATPGVASLRRLSAVAAEVHAALVIVLRAGPQPASGSPTLREVSGGPQPVPMLVVWDAAARQALDSPANRAGAVTVSAHIAAPALKPVRLRNVIGVLRGSDPALRDTYVLVSAHYDHLGVRGSGLGDHIYNGANDDASGTASVIEMAQALASLPERPRRSIVFLAFFGEELGLLGSRYYVRHPVLPLAATVAEINIEQVGRTDDKTGPRVALVNVTGYDYTSIPAVLAKAGQAFGIAVVKDEQASDPFFARADNQAFADAGIPAHTLSVGYEFSDYHQPGDEWPKLDYDNLAKVDRTVALALYQIADSSEAPRWNTANPKTERYVKARQAAAAAR